MAIQFCGPAAQSEVKRLDYASVDELLKDAWRLRGREADAILSEAVVRYPEDIRVHTAYAWMAVERGQWEEGLRRWQSVATGFRSRPDGICGAVGALLALGRFDEAKTVLAPAVTMFPDDRQVLVMKGWVATRLRDVAAAEAAWREVRERFPDEQTGYFGCAAALRDDLRLVEAENLLLEGMPRFPDVAEFPITLAQLAVDRRDWPLAVERWQAALDRFPVHPRIHAGLGTALLEAGDEAGAREVFEVAMQICGDDFVLGAADATAAVRLYGFAEAMTRWAQVVTNHPQNPDGHASFGRMLRESGHSDQAAMRLTAALERFPGNFDIELELALTISDQRDWGRALALWESLKRRYPDNGAVRTCLAHVLWQAQQDQLSAIAEGGEVFEIPPLLLDNSVTDESGADLGQAMKALFLRFESIGDNCEFGMVQRRFGAEPLSLLRWTATPPDLLVAALDSDFAGVGAPENTIVEIRNGEFITRDSRYYMFSHTFTLAGAVTLETFAPQHLRRMQFLRRKLLDDLRAAKRILVYKSNDGVTEDEAMAIHQALRRYNPDNVLLYVQLATPAHDPGTVVIAAPGLYAGYIDRFSMFDISVDCWVRLCQRLIEMLPNAAAMREMA
jgi:tetratricopeptide (TPR) repeat protein